MSLDGFITRGSEPGTAFTSPEDKDWFGKTMSEFPIKVLGRKTFEVSRDFILGQSQEDGSGLRIVLTRDPSKYCEWHFPGRLEFTDRSIAEVVSSLKAGPMADSKVAVLGGGAIYSAFLNSYLLDEFWITLEPQLFGSGAPIVTEPSLPKLTLKESIQLGPSTLLLKYRRTKS